MKINYILKDQKH